MNNDQTKKTNRISFNPDNKSSVVYIPELAINEVYRLMTLSEHGKHAGRDWRALGVDEHIKHLDYHIENVWENGESIIDSDSQMLTLVHVAARALMAIECVLIEQDKTK